MSRVGNTMASGDTSGGGGGSGADVVAPMACVRDSFFCVCAGSAERTASERAMHRRAIDMPDSDDEDVHPLVALDLAKTEAECEPNVVGVLYMGGLRTG